MSIRTQLKKITAVFAAFVLVLSTMGPMEGVFADTGHTDHNDGNTWVEWTETNSLPNSSGYYYLGDDVSLEACWNVPSGGVSLCLNGHSITYTGVAGFPIIMVDSKTLTICDCNTQAPGSITGGNSGGQDSTAGGVLITSGGTFTLDGGIITGNTGTKGGAIQVRSGSTFIMNGGSITGNTATVAGAGIFVQKDEAETSTFIMNGGTISNNIIQGSSDKVYGAGVFLNANTTMTMNDGVISGNKRNGSSTLYGGGLYLQTGASANIKGGKISGNEGSSGGGAYIADSKLIMDGGEISENSGTYGGGVFAYGDQAVFTMNGGVIKNNTSSEGDVFVNNNSKFEFKGGSIEGSQQYGVYNEGGVFEMTGGTIKEHSEIGVYNSGEMKMSGGTITENACGLYLIYNTLILGGTAKITGNNSAGGVTNNLCVNQGSYTDLNISLGTGDEGNGVAIPSDGMSVGLSVSYPLGGNDSMYREEVFIEEGVTPEVVPYFFSDDSDYGVFCVNRKNDSGRDVGQLSVKIGGFDLCDGMPPFDDYPTDDEMNSSLFLYYDDEYDFSYVEDAVFDGWYTQRTGGDLVSRDGEDFVAPYTEWEPGVTYYAHWKYDSSADSVTILTEPVYLVDGSVIIDGRSVGNDVLTEYGLSYNSSTHDLTSIDAHIMANVNQLYENAITDTAEWGFYYTYDNQFPSCVPGVYIDSGETFNMLGGSIEYCSLLMEDYEDISLINEYGGGIYVGNGGKFNMSAGLISGNMAFNGGGVFVDNGGSFDMSGGEIKENVAHDMWRYNSYGAGGGVFLENGSAFTMTGGSINNNSAQGKGGGVCVSSAATFIMSGGTITANDASAGYDLPEYGGGIYYAALSEEFSCLAEGTMITMPDGSHKAIETLKIGDEVLAFDHETGETVASKIYSLYEYPEKKTGAFTLHFTGGNDVTVVGGHLFYEQETNSYALIEKDNVKEYIGHHFFNLDNECWEELKSFSIVREPVRTFFIATEEQINCITDSMLSNEDGFFGKLCNIFEYDEDMKYDSAKKAADIERYGLWDYTESEYTSEYAYDALNLQYIRVAIGKGKLSLEELKQQGAYYKTRRETLGINSADEPLVKTSEPVLNSDGMYEVIEEVAPASRLFMSNPTPSTGITLGGTAVVADNSDSDLFLPEGMTVNLGTGIGGCSAPGLGMYVGVTLGTGTGQITINGTEADTRFFVPSNRSLYTAYDSGHLVLAEIPEYNYVVSITQPENGFVYADKSVAEVDEVITLTYAPAEGYAFAVYCVTKQIDGSPVTVSDEGTFTMPEGGVNVTATFTEIPKYTVSFNVGGHAGSISDMTDVPEGSTITLPTPTPTDAYQFLGWFKEAEFTNQWDADTDTVTANTTLYAKWKAPDPTPTPTPDPTPTPEPEPEEEPEEEAEEEQEEQEEQVEEEKEKVPDPLTLPKEEVKADINKGLVVDQKGKSAMLTWGEIEGADGYTVYGAYCGSKKYEKLATIKAGDITQFKASKLGGKAINLKKNTKYYVAAYKLVDGKKVRITKSLLVRMVSKTNDTYTSTEKVELEKDFFTIKKGKKATIKATTLLKDDSKDALTSKYGPEFRYASDNEDVATVSKNGKITAVGKGVCKIWVYSRNGKAVSVDVTVK